MVASPRNNNRIGAVPVHVPRPVAAVPNALVNAAPQQAQQAEASNSEDRAERIADLVGNARRQTSYRGELLASDQLLLHLLELDVRLLEAAELMAAHSFSLGDPSKNRLGRSTESDSGFGGAGGSAGRPAQTPSFGATPIVTVDGGEMDVLGSGALPADELDDLVHEMGDDEDDSIFRETSFEQQSSRRGPSKPQRKPFWVAADPINGFVPETMDFARMTEAADATQAPEAGTPGVAGGPDPNTAKLHANLRADHAAWAETPIDALKARADEVLDASREGGAVAEVAQRVWGI